MHFVRFFTVTGSACAFILYTSFIPFIRHNWGILQLFNIEKVTKTYLIWYLPAIDFNKRINVNYEYNDGGSFVTYMQKQVI